MSGSIERRPVVAPPLAPVPHPSWSSRNADVQDGGARDDKMLRRRFVQEPDRLAEFWGLLDE